MRAIGHCSGTFAACACFANLAIAQAPPFKTSRYDEDYSYLSASASPVDLGDRIKYIRLGDDAYLSLGGEIRERFESFDAPKFGIGAAADDYVLQRLLLSADAHLNDRLRGFVQLVQANAFRKASPLSPSDADHLDILNAFFDVKPDPDRTVTLRLGRQELYLNPAQRFVSLREGPNVRQSFDGLRVTWSAPKVRVDAFLTRPVLYKIDTFDDSSDRTQSFSGVSATSDIAPRQSVNGYLLYLDRQNVTFGLTKGNEHRESIGARWAGSEGPFDHDIEAVYQGGSFANQDIRAWAFGLVGGCTFADPRKPRVGLEFDAGSGDRRASDGRLETFNPMFPKGVYFNESALISWANLLLIRANVGFQPTPSTTLQVSVFERWRETGGDAVYLQPYSPLNATRTNAERRVGTGFQLDATWRVDRYLTFVAEVLHQGAGPAIQKASGRSVDFAMFIAQFRF